METAQQALEAGPGKKEVLKGQTRIALMDIQIMATDEDRHRLVLMDTTASRNLMVVSVYKSHCLQDQARTDTNNSRAHIKAKLKQRLKPLINRTKTIMTIILASATANHNTTILASEPKVETTEAEQAAATEAEEKPKTTTTTRTRHSPTPATTASGTQARAEVTNQIEEVAVVGPIRTQTTAAAGTTPDIPPQSTPVASRVGFKTIRIAPVDTKATDTRQCRQDSVAAPTGTAHRIRRRKAPPLLERVLAMAAGEAGIVGVEAGEAEDEADLKERVLFLRIGFFKDLKSDISFKHFQGRKGRVR
jgi:hypothetical protein